MDMGALPQTSKMSSGFVPVKSAGRLVAEEQEKQQEERKRAEPPTPFIDNLTNYIESCWTDAKEAKLTVEEEMMQSLRQRNGEYEVDVLREIRNMGGSEVYVMLTSTKCRAAEAWINDVLRPVTEYPFSISPTPIAELPPPQLDSIRNEVYQLSDMLMQRAQQIGMQFQNAEIIQELREYAMTRKDEAMEEIQEEAEARADRMETKITDQMAQGGWFDAFWAVVSDFVTLKAGVLKGPVIRNKKVQKWIQDPQTGKWVVDLKKEFVPCYSRVSPFDIYPAPDSRHVDDGYIIERHRLARTELQALLGVPGYDEENIRAALRDYSKGLFSREPIDSERASIEFHGEIDAEERGEKIEALEFWGSVQGKLLKEWGLEEDLDPEMDYEVNAWKVGNYTIRAILNPDKLGRKPYSVDSFERIPGSFWGKGIPELMKDIQGVCNAVARALVNNAGIASGPQVEVNIERCDDDEEIYPWKIWQADNKQLSESKAVHFYQPDIVVDPLLKVFEFFSALSEDQTGVPRWAYGNTNVGGAGDTSSGLHTLMNYAARGIKESIAHLDTMIAGAVKRTYDYNMMYDPDDSIKGDCRVVARGSSSLVQKEQQVIRTREFLQATNNPVDNEIVGYEGRAKLLREAAKGLGLDVGDIVPQGKELKALVSKLEAQAAQQLAMQQQAAMQKGQVPGAKPQSLDASGAPAGGTDANMVQNQPGTTPGLRTVPTT
jgi:hypothetical protein